MSVTIETIEDYLKTNDAEIIIMNISDFVNILNEKSKLEPVTQRNILQLGIYATMIVDDKTRYIIVSRNVKPGEFKFSSILQYLDDIVTEFKINQRSLLMRETNS